jgi:hypothetical protein
MLIQKIQTVMSDLSAALTEVEAAGGWTEESKNAILMFFQDLLLEVESGKEIPYVGLVRGLDAWGINRGGTLYEKAMEIARELNARLE